MHHIHRGLYWVSGKSPMPRPDELSHDIFNTFERRRYSRSIVLPNMHEPNKKSYPYTTPFSVYTFDGLPHWSFWQPPHTYSAFALSVNPIPMHYIMGEMINSTYLSIDPEPGNRLLHAQREYVQSLINISEFIKLPLILICLETEYDPVSIDQLMGDNIPANTRILNYRREQIPNFLHDISQILETTEPIQKSDVGSEISPEVWAVPGLPNVTVPADYIGIAEGVADNYVREMSRQLISKSILFSIWVDIAERPPTIHSEEEAEAISSSLKWEILYDDISISSPWLNEEPQPSNMSHEERVFSTAYHTYIEVEGIVYDCFKAFNGIPLNTYQNNINGVLRDKIEIHSTSANSIEVSTIVETLLRQAKYPFYR